LTIAHTRGSDPFILQHTVNPEAANQCLTVINFKKRSLQLNQIEATDDTQSPVENIELIALGVDLEEDLIVGFRELIEH
jgi:hypothetical protein